MDRLSAGKLVSLVVVTTLVATGCRGCGEDSKDKTKQVDTGTTAPKQVDTGPSEEAKKKAEDAAVSLAVSTSEQSRFIAGNLEAEETPDEPAPSPDPAVPEKTTGSLKASELQKVFNDHAAEAQKCYERALKMNQGLAGRVVLTLTISRDGSVAAATARGDSLRSKAVNDCLEQQARGWSFPKPTGGAAKVRKPYNFSPKR